MSTNYPTTLDTTTQLPDVLSSDNMNTAGKEHDVMHTNVNEAVLALQTKVGVNGSADPNSIDYKINNSTIFGYGAPSTFARDGSLYFDITASTFVGYVQQTGVFSPTPGTVVTGQFSSSTTSTGTVSTPAAGFTLVLAVCYEHPSVGGLSISSVTSPHLTWTHYVTSHGTYSAGNNYTEIWYAQSAQALTNETVTWNFAGGSVDDGAFFLIPVQYGLTSGDPFIDGGTTGLPAQVPVTSGSECVTGTLVAPNKTLMIAIESRSDNVLPGSPVGFTSIGTVSNGAASRYEYARASSMMLTSNLNGTITSGGLAGTNGTFAVIALAQNPTYRSWQPFT